MMKFLASSLLFASLSSFSEPVPKQLFTIENLSHPESVLIRGNSIFVSEMGNDTRSKEIFDGSVRKFSQNGKKSRSFKTKVKFINPMGMGIIKNTLYVADYNRIVGISTKSGKMKSELSLEKYKASFLNDVAVVKNRYLIVSATKLKKLFLIDTRMKNVKELNINLKGYAPNGLHYDNKSSMLYLASNEAHILGNEGNGKVLKYKLKLNLKGGKLLEEISLGRFLDGIALKGEELLVSDWGGVENDGIIYFLDKKTLSKNDRMPFLLPGLADFDYSEHKNLLVLPDLMKGKVRAYNLK